LRISAVHSTPDCLGFQRLTDTIPSMAKRGYSRDFTPKTERRVQLMIDRVPPTLLNAARAKAKRDGISLRALILGWLREWVDGAR
jgi:hypothetical protein